MSAAEKKPKPPASEVTVRTVGNRAALVAAKAAKRASKGKAWGSLKNADKDAILHHLAKSAGLVD